MFEFIKKKIFIAKALFSFNVLNVSSLEFVDAYIIEENKDKYLVFAFRENNKKMLKMYKKLCSEVKKQIECNSTESIKHEKDPMKIRLDS